MDTIYPTFIENGRLNIDNIDQNELPLKIELIDLDAKIIFEKIIFEIKNYSLFCVLKNFPVQSTKQLPLILYIFIRVIKKEKNIFCMLPSLNEFQQIFYQ